MLKTPRLTLIPATLAHVDAEIDAPETFGALLGATVPPGWPPGLYDRDAMAFFRQQLREHGDALVGWLGWYAVLDAPEPTLVACGGYFGPPEDGAVEIGYSVVESFRRRGIATELIGALVENAFARGVDTLTAHTDTDNLASQAALRRAGFVETGPGVEPNTVRFEFERSPHRP